MYILNQIKNAIKKNSFFCLVYIPCTVFVVTTGLLLLCYPEAAVHGVKKGVTACLDILIPTLFPFLFLSQLAMELKIFNIKNKAVSRFTQKVFAFPGKALAIIALSLIGGFPLGAILTKTAYEKGEISISQGQRLLLFCVNPGPSFALSTIGYAMYGSKNIGLIVYFSSVISSLIIGVLSRFLSFDEYIVESNGTQDKKISLPYAVNEAVNSSLKGIVNICVWVVVFSCIGELTKKFGFSENTLDFIYMITEVTNGVYRAASNYDLPIVCAVIGFAGFCLHIQVLPSLMRLKLKYRYFLVSRIVAASFNCIICYFLLDLFPQSVTTVLSEVKNEAIDISASAPLCICLMLLCVLFIGGNSITVAFRKNKRRYDSNKTQLY